MLKSRLYLARQLSDHILEIPELVDQFAAKSPDAVNLLLAWFDRVEAIMLNNRMIEAAMIAGYKSQIIAPALDDRRGMNLRKRQQAVAISLVHQIQEGMAMALRPHLAKIDQARDIANQLLQIVAQAKVIQLGVNLEIRQLAEQIWNVCVNHDQLKPLAVQLKTILSQDDVIWLLAEEIEPADFA